MTDPVEAAKAVLVIAGRPELAARVNRNSAGWPSMHHDETDHPLIVAAFLIAHIAGGHPSRIGTDDDDGRSCIDCEICWSVMNRAAYAAKDLP
jgi:hypothetical protein